MLIERTGFHAMQRDIAGNLGGLGTMRKQHEQAVIRKNNAVIDFSCDQSDWFRK